MFISQNSRCIGTNATVSPLADPTDAEFDREYEEERLKRKAERERRNI